MVRELRRYIHTHSHILHKKNKKTKNKTKTKTKWLGPGVLSSLKTQSVYSIEWSMELRILHTNKQRGNLNGVQINKKADLAKLS